MPRGKRRIQEVDVRRHAFPALLEESTVAEAAMDRPRADHDRVRPGGSAIQPGEGPGAGHRGDRRNPAVLALGVLEIEQPFREEPRHLHVEGGGANEDLGIAGPAEALVALRAVRGHVHEVAALAPDDVALKLVQVGIRAAEGSRLGHVGVEHHARELLDGALFQLPRYLHVAEAVEGEAGLEALRLAAAAKGEGVGGAGVSEILGVELARFVEDLGVTQLYRRALLASHPKANPSHHVLAEIEDPARGEERMSPAHGILHRMELTDCPHRRAAHGVERDRRRLGEFDRRPAFVVVAGFRPGAQVAARVHRLPLHDVGGEDRRRVPAPPLVAGDARLAPVLVHDLELGEQGGAPSVVLAGLHQADVPAVPAITEERPDRIVALAEVAGDVVDLVAHALGVVGPPRRELLVADATAVDPALVETQRGDVEARPRDRAGDLERPPQRGNHPTGSWCTRERRRDPPGRPVGRLEQADLEAGGGAPGGGLPVGIEALHLPEGAPAGTKRRARIDHLCALVRRDLAAVPEIALVPLQPLRIGGDQQAVGALAGARALVVELPEEAGLAGSQPDGVDLVLTAQRARASGGHANPPSREDRA